MVVTHGHLPRTAARAVAGHAVTVGNFDGVHRGHRAMLDRLVREARGRKLASCAVTFEPHPREFFAPGSAPTRLARLREKLELIAEAGVDRVHVLRFGAPLAGMAPERFVSEVLAGGLGARWLLVGRDFRYGAKRAGDFVQLQASGAALGFEVEAMPDVLDGGERISSSAVREALSAGDFARAERLLGRRYTMSGRVAHGEKLGRELGFPTANIVLRRKSPLAGIFVVEVELEETRQKLKGVASVGRRPTVKESAAPLLEVHLFDFAGAIYGRHLRVAFLAKLRDEKKYGGLPALRDAIEEDAARAREWFSRIEWKHG
ncbi:MAG: bifunctional riboflavin kinase/FAD synthetase [Betaproteobacteria bacterium]